MTDEYDTPPTPEVLQEDVDLIQPVPVLVDQPLRVDIMPTEVGSMRNVLLKAGAAAEKVVNGDGRRRRVILWGIDLAAGSECICVSDKKTDCDDLTGVMLWCGTGRIRYEFEVINELWVRGAKINHTSGTFTGFAVSTTDVILSVITEQWSR